MNNKLALFEEKQIRKTWAENKWYFSIEEKTVEAAAGGGVVKVVANGKKELLSVEISPEAVDPDDVETLQDLIMVAVNEAVKKADDMMAEGMGAITGGLNIPGLF